MLETVEHVGRAVFDAVLVAGDQAATDPTIVEPLAAVIEFSGVGVDPLDDFFGFAAVVRARWARL